MSSKTICIKYTWILLQTCLSIPLFSWYNCKYYQDASSVVADHDELEIEDARLASLIRKIVLPYKRANKKLKDMESEQGKLETIMTRLEEKFTRHLEDINRFITEHIQYSDPNQIKSNKMF